MGSIGVMELAIILLILIVPVIAIVIAYKVGKQSGENRMLRRLEEERRSKI
jgi:hypothetical protein